MMYSESRFTVDEKTRHVQADWHELIVNIARCARVFRDTGHPRESSQLYAYMTTFAQHAARHLERLVSTNGHDKDSTVGTELPGFSAALEDPTVNGQAPADETGACADCSHGELSVTPNTVPVTAVPSIEDRIQTAIAVVDDLMGKHPDHQGYEVALKMLHRGRSHARVGKCDLAERQLRAAENAMHEAKAIDL